MFALGCVAAGSNEPPRLFVALVLSTNLLRTYHNHGWSGGHLLRGHSSVLSFAFNTSTHPQTPQIDPARSGHASQMASRSAA